MTQWSIAPCTRRWQRAGLGVLALLGAACAQMPAPAPLPAECAVKELVPAQAMPGALTVTYFGTSTMLFQHGSGAVMTDGFFTRPGGLLRLVLWPIWPKAGRIRDMLTADGMPAGLAAVLVTHSHHDHALDSAIVAQQSGATLVGSASTMAIAKGQLTAPEFAALKFMPPPLHSPVELGGFLVGAIPSTHSPSPKLIGPGLDGDITAPLAMPAHVLAFNEGGTYAFQLRHPAAEILVVPSAGLLKKSVRKMEHCGTKACVVFLSIGGLGTEHAQLLQDLWEQVVVQSGARVVVPIHWDDWTKPLSDPLPVAPKLFGDVDASMQTLAALACKTGVKVRLLPPVKAFDVNALGG